MTAGRLFQHALPHPTVPALRILQPTGLANDHIQKPRAEGGEPCNETMGVREATVPQGLPLGSQGWLCLYSESWLKIRLVAVYLIVPESSFSLVRRRAWRGRQSPG